MTLLPVTAQSDWSSTVGERVTAVPYFISLENGYQAAGATCDMEPDLLPLLLSILKDRKVRNIKSIRYICLRTRSLDLLSRPS